MFEKIPASDISGHTIVTLDMFSVSRAFHTLAAFLQGTELVEQYRVDSSALGSFRIAAAQVCGVAKDKTRDVPQVFDTTRGKAGQWRDVRKDEKVPNGAKTRTVKRHSWQPETLRQAIKTLAETRKVSIGDDVSARTATDKDNSYRILTLARIVPTTEADAS
jgi:hypothetical protein